MYKSKHRNDARFIKLEKIPFLRIKIMNFEFQSSWSGMKVALFGKIFERITRMREARKVRMKVKIVKEKFY